MSKELDALPAHTLLRPKSVAVVGASDNPTRFNGAPVRNLIDFGFKGKIFPVNPKKTELYGLPCYASMSELSEVPETAVIAVRAGVAIDALEECARLGVRSATLISAGFVEGAAGEAGSKLGERLRRILNDSDIRLVGPNTAGLQNLLENYVPRAAVNQFGPEACQAGETAIISQSGALSNIIFNKCQANGIGIAYSVATGSQVDLDVPDFMEYAIADAAVKTLIVVIEGYGNGPRFADMLARAAEAGKPVILMKLGRTEEGAKMAQTHSGAMAGSYRVFRSVMDRYNVIEAVDFDQICEIASLFQAWGTQSVTPKSEDKANLGVIALSGGDGAFIADQIEGTTLKLGDTTQDFKDSIALDTTMAYGGNPFDPTGEVIANPDLLRRSVESFVVKNSYDYHLFAAPVLGPQITNVFIPALADTASRYQEKRFALTMWTAGSLTDGGVKILREGRAPLFQNSGRAVAAINKHSDWSSQALSTSKLVPTNDIDARVDPYYWDLRKELSDAGLTFASAIRLYSAEESGLADDGMFAGPKVLKLNCRSGQHKAAAGFLKLGILSQAELVNAMEIMPTSTDHDGYVLEDQVHADMELFIGGSTDPDFGKVVLVGFGGSLAEALGEPALWAGSFSEEELRGWIRQSTVGRTLAHLHDDIRSVVERNILSVARWFMDDASLTSFDINPIRVDLHAKRVLAADCRLQ